MPLCVEIRKRLGNFQLDVQFQAGEEAFALLGASGCGKSLTLRCIAGVLTPDEGRIVLNGRTLFDSAAKINLPPQRRRVGYLFQHYALFPNMTVRQNIAAAVRERSRRGEAATQKIQQFQLETVANLRPHQLSGGQRQRTALARVLASEPDAILLDEPLSALDSYLKSQLELELAGMLEQFSGPTVWVSHDRGEIFRNCHRVCVMDRGRSQVSVLLEDLMSHPGTEAAAKLSGCENFAAAIPEGDKICLPEWGLTLSCEQDVSNEIRRVGIRACGIQIAEPEQENAFLCKVGRVVEDVSTIMVWLHPDGAAEDAPPLRMDLDKSISVPSGVIAVCVPADKLLLLRE